MDGSVPAALCRYPATVCRSGYRLAVLWPGTLGGDHQSSCDVFCTVIVSWFVYKECASNDQHEDRNPSPRHAPSSAPYEGRPLPTRTSHDFLIRDRHRIQFLCCIPFWRQMMHAKFWCSAPLFPSTEFRVKIFTLLLCSSPLLALSAGKLGCVALWSLVRTRISGKARGRRVSRQWKSSVLLVIGCDPASSVGQGANSTHWRPIPDVH
jgi:hypothetical protein